EVGYAVTQPMQLLPLLTLGLVAVLLYWGINILFGVYQRIWSYASAGETLVLAESVASGTALFFFVDLLWPGGRPVSPIVVLFTGLVVFVGFAGLRYRSRVWTELPRRWWIGRRRAPVPRQRLLIVGAGEAGQLLARRLLHEPDQGGYDLVGFVDDDPNKHGLRIHNLKVWGDRNNLREMVDRHRVDLVVVAIHNIPGESFRQLLRLCEQTSARVQVLPSLIDLMQGAKGGGFIRDVTPEDLLGREQVSVDQRTCQAILQGKRVLVTGAAGTIGAELCRRVLSYGPEQLVLLDQDESGLYELQVELAAKDTQPGASHVISAVADVTHRDKMRALFEAFRPQVVFHAAAYKHVPLMEEHPDEAVRTNVKGTWIVAEMAAQHGAERFVFISTDKAVNPSSVMGATKRIGELMVMSSRALLARRQGGIGTDGWPGVSPQDGTPLFTAVRFGNVLRSRGSVVPLFERMIERGGPVTVTHPEMTRYFMSLTEAVSLVVQAAALTEGGDLFLLDMGQRINIDELARRLIRLRGLRPGVDIPIVYTGPRPGERLHEELIGETEERLPTSHPHIFSIRSRSPSHVTPADLDFLIALAEGTQRVELVAALFRLVGQPHPAPSA
ncbi:MAG: polysaccharide biosynthesis protein, partial [Dehalococcoidia bacterium]|nr:polysaccharide biosynthesis protein [Dehalococcoidia bacterium]